MMVFLKDNNKFLLQMETVIDTYSLRRMMGTSSAEFGMSSIVFVRFCVRATRT